MFRATRETQEVCSACLEAEFASGVSSTEAQHDENVKEYVGARKRQIERAARMGRAFRSRSAYSVVGKVRCGLAMVLFLVCVFFFVISDGEQMTVLNQLDFVYQISISISVAVISSLLLLPSFSRHKIIISSTILLMLTLGATMPLFWNYKVPESTEYTHTVGSEAALEEAQKQSGRLLTDKDIPAFVDLERTRPGSVHYCIFIRCDMADRNTTDGVLYFGSMEQSTRNLVRSSLSRQLEGAKVEINNSPNGEGVIFTASNVKAERKNISNMLSRYGEVYFSDAARGVYEILLDSDKIKIGEDVDPMMLLDYHRPGFVEANMRALQSLDAKLVAAAADRLAKANVPMLRGDVAHRLAQTLQSSWKTEPATYKALAEALVVYARDDEPQLEPLLWEYFESNLKAGRGVSSTVVARLAQIAPQRMKTPVLKLWQSNPAAWNQIAGLLAAELEPFMISQLSRQDLPVKELTDVLNYIQLYGTAQALPVLSTLESHPDKAVARKVANTISEIQRRQSAAQ